jgi:hypothetical protein
MWPYPQRVVKVHADWGDNRDNDVQHVRLTITSHGAKVAFVLRFVISPFDDGSLCKTNTLLMTLYSAPNLSRHIAWANDIKLRNKEVAMAQYAGKTGRKASV